MARDIHDPAEPDHGPHLSILARSDTAALKAQAETLLPALPEIDVLRNETGLVMLPLRDTGQGTAFHLGEVLVAHAHIAAQGGEGYGMRIGDDAEAAMAMAVLDLALTLDVERRQIRDFIAAQAARQADQAADRLRRVEATRVRMETF